MKFHQVAQVLGVFHLSTNLALQDAHQLAFVQFFRLTPPVDKMDRILHYDGQRWAAEDLVDHSNEFTFSSSDTVEDAKWYGLVQFSPKMLVQHIVGSKYCVTPFSLQISWPGLRMYVSKF